MAKPVDQVAGFIAEQPRAVTAAWRAAWEALADLDGPAGADVALVGSGSSLNALTAQAPAIAGALRAPVHLRGPLAFMADLEAGRLHPGLVVVLSQSGMSRTTIEAAAMALDRGIAVLRVTAEPESGFGRLPGRAIVMPIGPEPIGPKTKGYTASLAVLAALADRLAGREASPVTLSANLVGRARTAADALAEAAGDVDFLLVAGQGPHVGTALEASLKIAEMSGVPAAAFDTEEVLHGRMHGLTSRSLAVFIAATEGEAALAGEAARVLSELGVDARILGPSLEAGIFGHGSPGRAGPARALDPVAAIVPFQWLARALAIRRGLDPARMRYPDLSRRLAIKTDDRRDG